MQARLLQEQCGLLVKHGLARVKLKLEHSSTATDATQASFLTHLWPPQTPCMRYVWGLGCCRGGGWLEAPMDKVPSPAARMPLKHLGLPCSSVPPQPRSPQRAHAGPPDLPVRL